MIQYLIILSITAGFCCGFRSFHSTSKSAWVSFSVHRTDRASWQLRQHPHYVQEPRRYVGEIWKHSFISTVRPTVHSYPSRVRSFLKRKLFKPEEFENAGFRFRVDGNILKMEPFWRPENHLISLPHQFFSNTFPKWQVISVDPKQFVRFQIE